jgi:hypothetical protein
MPVEIPEIRIPKTIKTIDNSKTEKAILFLIFIKVFNNNNI